MRKTHLKLVFALLAGLLLVGCVQLTPKELTPEQQEIAAAVNVWKNAWNSKDISLMDQVYEPGSPELAYVKETLRGQNTRIRVYTRDILIMDDGEAMVTGKVSGDWERSFVAAYIKKEGRWLLQGGFTDRF